MSFNNQTSFNSSKFFSYTVKCEYSLSEYGIRYSSTSSISSLTTRELRTFRTLYGSRELLNTLSGTLSSQAQGAALAHDLRTFYIPNSISG
jgi:hypothetical protein